MLQDFLWVEKYRPKTVEDTILPADLKATFQQFVEQKNVPNLILTGGPGVVVGGCGSSGSTAGFCSAGARVTIFYSYALFTHFFNHVV